LLKSPHAPPPFEDVQKHQGTPSTRALLNLRYLITGLELLAPAALLPGLGARAHSPAQLQPQLLALRKFHRVRVRAGALCESSTCEQGSWVHEVVGLDPGRQPSSKAKLRHALSGYSILPAAFSSSVLWLTPCSGAQEQQAACSAHRILTEHLNCVVLCALYGLGKCL